MEHREHEGHGTGGLEEAEVFVLGGDLLVFGLAGLQVGDPGLHVAGERLIGLVVEGHQLVGNGAVGELQTEVAAVVPVHQVVQPHVPPVVHKPGQDLQIPPGLFGDIAHPVGDPGGHPHHIVRHHVLLQQGVKDAGGKNGPKGPALQHQSDFHALVLLACFLAGAASDRPVSFLILLYGIPPPLQGGTVDNLSFQ